MSVFEIKAPTFTLAIPGEDQAELVRSYYIENRTHLEPWEPARPEHFYSLEATRDRLRNTESAFANGTAYHFVILDIHSGRMIGAISFSNIVKGIFQACHLGYSVSASHQGKGIMFEALQVGIKYMFDTIGLHRIMANHMPSNERSARLLKRLGFEKEGYAKSYLKIAGVWQDHVLNSKINEDD